MSKVYLIPSIVTDVLLSDLDAHLADQNLSLELCDLSSAEQAIEADANAQFLIFTARLETLKAADALESEAESERLLGEFASRAISLFEKDRNRVLLLDLEEACVWRTDAFRTLVQTRKWSEVLETLVNKVDVPSALQRLMWIEKKAELGINLLEEFATLEACTTPLHDMATDGVADGQKILSGRRLRLLEEAKAELEEAKAELERSRLAEEVSDLLISQLQEELEATLCGSPRESLDPDGAQNSDQQSAQGQWRDTKVGGSGKKGRFWLSKLGGRFSLKLRRDAKLVARSGLFDADWYLANYPDVAASNMKPLMHFVMHGAAEGRDPSPRFSTNGYLWRNPDIDPNEVNPLVHSITTKPNGE